VLSPVPAAHDGHDPDWRTTRGCWALPSADRMTWETGADRADMTAAWDSDRSWAISCGLVSSDMLASFPLGSCRKDLQALSASKSDGTIERCPLRTDRMTTVLNSDAVAVGNCDQSRARPPVTRAAATLVPETGA